MPESSPNHNFIDCEGYLYKTGGKGHTIKNQKKRYFILRGHFLSYYTLNPNNSHSKRIELLKGHIYLPGCKISDIFIRNNKKYFVFTNRMFKEFIFSSIHDDNHQNSKEIIIPLDTWHKKISKSIERSTYSLLNDSINGSFFWKCKDQKNWKKRFFILKGNILFYFSIQPRIEDFKNGLRGWIDLFEVKNITMGNDKTKPSFSIEANSSVYTIQHEEQSLIDKWFLHISNQLKKIKIELPQNKIQHRTLSKVRNRQSTLNKKKKVSKEVYHFSYNQNDINIKRFSSILRVFKSLKLSDDDLWDCPLIVMKILLHYSQLFINCIENISLKFPLEIEVYINDNDKPKRKVFNVCPLTKIEKIKEKICSYLTIDNHYVITTLNGSILDDNHYIGMYGFGAIYKGWKLKMKDKRNVNLNNNNNPQITMNELNIKCKYPILIVSTDTKFNNYPILRIYIDPQWTSIDILKKISEKGYLNQYNEYYFTSIDGKIINNDIPFELIGLGNRFKYYTLLLNKKDKNYLQNDDNIKSMKYLWVQYDENITLDETKDIIYTLECIINEKMEIAKDTVMNLRRKLDEMDVKMKELEIENDILRMNKSIKEERKKIDINKQEEEETILEIDKMIDHLNKFDITSDNEENNNKIDDSIFKDSNISKFEKKDNDFYCVLMNHLNDLDSLLKKDNNITQIKPLNIGDIKYNDDQTDESNNNNQRNLSPSKIKIRSQSKSTRKRSPRASPLKHSPRSSNTQKQSQQDTSTSPIQSPRKQSSPRSKIKSRSSSSSKLQITNNDSNNKKTSLKSSNHKKSRSAINKNNNPSLSSSSSSSDNYQTDLYKIIIDLEKRIKFIDLSSPIDIQEQDDQESKSIISFDIII